jgi:alpha-galactosidase
MRYLKRSFLFIITSTFPFLGMSQSYQVGNVNLKISGKDDNFKREVKISTPEEGIQEVEIILIADKMAMPKLIVLEFKQPSLDIQSYISPYGADANSEPTSLYNYPISRMIPVSFAAKSKFTSAMLDQPSMTFFNSDDANRLTLAASELVFPVTFKAGENEDNGVGFDIRMGLFEYPTKTMQSYKVKIRFDTRNIHYNQAQKELLNWWKIENNLTFAFVPTKAYLPFYCTWYSLKADGVNAANVEKQAKMAKDLGCGTIIVDDGWQKALDAKAGYCLYNGDWEVDKTRFPDFNTHVKKVQAMGMSYMLWVGPTMIGEKSNIYNKFKDKMLYKADWAAAWVPDPRFPEVRNYLSQRLISLMKESGIDGFKIDFMDLMNSRFAGKNMKTGDGRDYESVEEATVQLIADIYKGCKAINPNVLIEFRQFFTNPILQQYANMFRAIDCPNNLLENRTRTLDARNLNNQVIHADPLVWNENEESPAAALQLLNTMLSVPQVSTDLSIMKPEHLKMLKFLLSQWTDFNTTLTRGNAINYGAIAYYSWSETSLDNKSVIVAYQPVVLNPTKMNKSTMLVNATHQNKMIFDLTNDFGPRNITVFNCTGDLIKKEKINFKGLVKIEVPASGIVRID